MKVINQAGHMLPLEKISETAEALVPYIKSQLQAYLHEEDFWAHFESGGSGKDKLSLSQRWMEEVRKKADQKRQTPDSKL